MNRHVKGLSVSSNRTRDFSPIIPSRPALSSLEPLTIEQMIHFCPRVLSSAGKAQASVDNDRLALAAR